MNGYVNESSSKDDSKSLLEQCCVLEKRYYEELDVAEKLMYSDESAGLRYMRSVMDKYSALFDKITSSYLKEKLLGPIETKVDLPALVNSDGTVSIDDELLDYVLNNSDYLRRQSHAGRHVIEDFDRDAYCLICDCKIKGLGLMDTIDAGVNAVCFKCIDKEHHYIGGGIYFTNFV